MQGIGSADVNHSAFSICIGCGFSLKYIDKLSDTGNKGGVLCWTILYGKRHKDIQRVKLLK